MKFILLLSALALAKKNKVPCWIAEPCEPYTTEQYIIGVGSGDTLELADTAAMGAITRQFTVTVNQLQTSTKDLAETSREGELVSSTHHQNLRTKTQVESSMELSGVQIASRYEYNDQVYSLAVLERSIWLQQIDSQRRDLQSQIQSLMFEAKKSEHHLDRFALYEQMMPIIFKDEFLYQQRTIVDSQGLGMPPSYTSAQLQQQYQQERNALYFVPQKMDNNDSLDNLIIEALQNQGFQGKHSLESQESVIFFRYSQEIKSEGPDQYGFITYKCYLTIELHTPQQSLGTFSTVASSSSRDEAKAKRGLESNLIKEIESLRPDIIEIVGE
jgi:hypothetical protein